MLNFNSILLSSESPQTLVGFYSEVLQMRPSWEGGEFQGFKVGDGAIVIGPHNKVSGTSRNPERILLGFETEDVKGEFERIKGIEGIEVIADPDNNYFQLISPMKF